MKIHRQRRYDGRRLWAIGLGLWQSPVFNPAQISSLGLWLTASPAYCFTDAGATTPCGDGDLVQAWKTHDGSITFSQATSGLRPTLVLTAGQWEVTFNRAASTIITATALANWPGSAHAWYSVAKVDVLGSLNALIGMPTSTQRLCYGWSAADAMTAIRSTTTLVSTLALSTDGTMGRWSYRSDGVSAGNIIYIGRKNGTDETSASGGGGLISGSSSTVAVGASGVVGRLDGRVREMLFFSANLDAATMALLDTYFAGRAS